MTATASLEPLFHPRSVAVVGASRDPVSLGYRTLEALVMNRFNGPVYPVNPSADVVGSIKAYPTVGSVPGPVDLAVIVVPKHAVLEVVNDCAAKGVKALVVLTAGFAETGPEGKRLQDQVVEVARSGGMRLVGPNCMGVINTDPDVRLNASFSPVFPPHGAIAMSSQSGALGLAIIGLAKRRGLGLSHFVSVGNKADVSGNDLLEFWLDDDATRVALLYVESFGQPERFARIARSFTRTKPIVAVKAGRTGAGRRAAGSHTAALASSDVVVDALFHQTGVIRAETLNEMFDLALALDSQPLPGGRRVAIVTNAGGPGILCADACESAGLSVEELSTATRSALDFLPGAASLGNPVDMIASAGPEHYRRTIATVLAAPEVDSLVAIYIPIDQALEEAYITAMAEGVVEARARGAAGKPVLFCRMSDLGVTPPVRHAGETIPAYTFPEAAARTLAKVTDYAEMRERPVGTVQSFPDADFGLAADICRAHAESHGPAWLPAELVRRVLEAAGLPVAPGGVAASAEEAVALAEAVGYPVAVKLVSTTLVHKTEYKALRLGVADAPAVRTAVAEIRAELERRGVAEAWEGVLVQPMLSGGVEVMLGVTRDRQFGPLVSFGLGGIHVEILNDVVFRVAPVTDVDAADMVRGIRGIALLEGYRGHPPGDLDALEEAVQRLSRLAEHVPTLMDMDLNPLFAMPPGQGCVIVDARIRVAPSE